MMQPYSYRYIQQHIFLSMKVPVCVVDGHEEAHKKTVFRGKRKLWIAYPALTQHAGMRPQAGPTNRHT
jgi:hypothetical protein